MGYFKHECLVVSGDYAAVTRAHGEACQLFDDIGYGRLVSGIKPHAVNCGASFFVSPDGSKEGWEPSNKCAEARGALVVHLRTTSLEWALILLGGDDEEFRVIDSPTGSQASEG